MALGGVLSQLGSIYDVDTLDTRFTTPPGLSYKAVIDARSDKRSDDALIPNTNTNPDKLDGSKRPQSPPRWRTPEFYLYYLLLSFIITSMFWVAGGVSQPSDVRYYKFERYLSPGWIPGRKIDISDAQYFTFRKNLPYMGLLLVFHPLLRRVWEAVYSPAAASSSPSRGHAPSRQGTPTPEAADARLRRRTSFDYAFAIVYLVALHGFSAAKILLILFANFKIATGGLPRKYIPAATWAFNICTLFANEVCHGYKFRSIALFFSGGAAAGDLVSDPSSLVRLGDWLDGHGGLMPRWQILFNITVLRLVSFNLDYYWSLNSRAASPMEKQLDPANLSERDRVSIPAAPGDFCFRNYVGYVIYAPLYLTGPIITFNDYISQQRYRPASIETPRTVRYGVRFLLVLLCMEVVLHYVWVGAISKAGADWSSYTPAQTSMLSFFNLHIIWLKLLLPWRFFRLWALVDGIDPPENMLRCVSDNYSTLSFWRAWHRSYYRWLLRYIYIPLGGAGFRSWRDSARSVVTYLMVFTFVAMWHDIKLNLLIWGWLIVFFFLPEIAATYLFPRRQWEARPTAYRMLCCAGAVANVLMMISANLVGFAVGIDGLQSILRGILYEYSGLLFLVTACGALFVGIQVMFEIRESELRRGIVMKC
ncbi:MBOAT, membrane-bound O-acyltransferase family-domain-containing protein [Lasiosphaeria ovina]|uniref:MBOAT, membrane-bound O-acyltransferase family-domain-containing protein n=1 Tax=Lasiosphaeria ovina TaxID=92902 RepID=A0AAE0TY29_9PEZI|nr:MBOAT, membrane-bound O-acyltransferase family-domain-containing protein [Lasiosphaeria ovina]